MTPLRPHMSPYCFPRAEFRTIAGEAKWEATKHNRFQNVVILRMQYQPYTLYYTCLHSFNTLLHIFSLTINKFSNKIEEEEPGGSMLGSYLNQTTTLATEMD